MNPMGLVPALVEDDFTLWESNAITRYLCGKYGQGSLWPADPRVRAVADTWMDWQQTACAPMMFPVFWAWCAPRKRSATTTRSTRYRTRL